jgi:hypothetical protein
MMSENFGQFTISVENHLNQYGIPMQPPTIYVDPDVPDNTIFIIDRSRIKIVRNIDTGERMIVFDYDDKSKGDKKAKGRTPAKNRQRKHR